jgi:hypothetical protein
MQGAVSFVSEKPWQNKVLHSFKLANDPTWYGMGTIKPPISKGDFVEFEVDVAPNGRVNVRGGNITVRKAAQASQQVAPAQAWKNAEGSGMTKDDYWKNREARDIVVQERIQYQSARNSAIAFVDLLLKKECVEPPKAMNKRYDWLFALVNEVTEKYNKPNTPDEPEAPAEAAVEETGDEMGKW